MRELVFSQSLSLPNYIFLNRFVFYFLSTYNLMYFAYENFQFHFYLNLMVIKQPNGGPSFADIFANGLISAKK
jgi:hypothetical protein